LNSVSREGEDEVQIELKVQSTDLTDVLRGYIEHRLSLAAGRFFDQVIRIRVRVSGLNGPRGGTRMSCQISADLKFLGKLVVQESDLDAHTAIDRAAARWGRLLNQRFERAEDLNRPPRVPAGTPGRADVLSHEAGPNGWADGTRSYQG
jgi:ribosome-associated translation inhibitor RaiA